MLGLVGAGVVGAGVGAVVGAGVGAGVLKGTTLREYPLRVIPFPIVPIIILFLR